MVLVLALFALLVLSCTEPQFTNSHDPDSNNYQGVSSSNVQTVSSSSVTLSGDALVYEGQTYRTVVINGQTWMAENLNYDADGSKCYGDSEENCTKYGRLYNWATANTICPNGWHLPSSDDWSALANYIMNDKSCTGNCDAKYLKSASDWNGEDAYNFTALPGGYGTATGNFSEISRSGSWWSSSEHATNTNNAYFRSMSTAQETSSQGANGSPKTFFYSVRCVMD